jgi:hypothetical protein
VARHRRARGRRVPVPVPHRDGLPQGPAPSGEPQIYSPWSRWSRRVSHHRRPARRPTSQQPCHRPKLRLPSRPPTRQQPRRQQPRRQRLRRRPARRRLPAGSWPVRHAGRQVPVRRGCCAHPGPAG